MTFSYLFHIIFPDLNALICVVLSGVVTAFVGTLFGLPSLRIKGFYLMVATLAAQFFLEWAFIRIPWLYNYNISGAIEVPYKEMFGIVLTGAKAEPLTRYFVCLGFLVVRAIILDKFLGMAVGRISLAVQTRQLLR